MSLGITRRGFLCGAGAGLAAGTSLSWLGFKALNAWQPPPGSHTPAAAPSAAGMPGLYPGRVVEVHDPGSVRADYQLVAEPINTMVDRGLCALTGADHAGDAWQRFFEAGDVVGIKVNPVGRRYSLGQTQAISSHELVLAVVAGLKSAGVRPQDIILFDRYADQFCEAGYASLLFERSMDGVRWYASSASYDNGQLDIKGFDTPRDSFSFELANHVAGYDPDVFSFMGYSQPDPIHNQKDDRRFRSHVSVIATRLVNKILNLPVLKDHGSAGVTLALKNLSHGLNNNVARSHLGKVPGPYHGVLGPNQCNTFIPTVVSQPAIRQKAVLHILDGLIAVYQGGPAGRNTWPYGSLFFATDPVALDHVGWGIVDDERKRRGFAPVAEAGLANHTAEQLARYPAMGKASESFDLRQPEHITLAGSIGLGIFDAARIDHRCINL